MSLEIALANAVTGLTAAQANLTLVSGNIANAQTPGYVEQSPTQVEISSGGDGSTVQMTGVNRTLDLDTGCVYGGHLSALRYPEMELVQVAAVSSYMRRARD